MSVQIDGTFKKKSGGGGLGSLIGKILGGGVGFVASGFNPMGAIAGSQIGGGVGGAAGNAIDPAKEQQLGVAVGKTGPSTNYKQETSAIDRLNKAFDIGSTIYGGANTINGMMTPKSTLGASSAIDRRLLRR